MDANEARRIELDVSEFITVHFAVEGRTFFEKLQYLGVASQVRDMVKKSLLDDLHEVRKLRNHAVHVENASIENLLDRVWEGLLRLAIPEHANLPYIITNKQSGKRIDVPCGFGSGKVHQWSGHDGKNQQWFLRKALDRSVSAISALSGKCLDIEGASLEPAWLQIWKYHGGNGQKFIFTQLEDGSYSIANKHSGLVLDSVGNNEGDWIHQYPWHGGDNQRWWVGPAFC
jgi:hypothetical protein